MPEDIKKETIDNETAENKAEEIEIEGADEESTQTAEETKDNKNIGSYAVLIDSQNISASNGSQTLAASVAGADAVITGQKRAWQTLTAYPLAVDQSYYYTFVKAGEISPIPVTNAVIPLQVSASIANDLGSSEKIELDGQAVISVVYL